MALDILGKHSTTEPHFQPVEAIFQSGRLTEAQEFQARLGNTEETTLNQESFDSRRRCSPSAASSLLALMKVGATCSA